MSTPNYFIQTPDGVLHGYWSLTILLCDLSANKSESVFILKLKPGIKTVYVPVSEAELRLEAA